MILDWRITWSVSPVGKANRPGDISPDCSWEYADSSDECGGSQCCRRTIGGCGATYRTNYPATPPPQSSSLRRVPNKPLKTDVEHKTATLRHRRQPEGQSLESKDRSRCQKSNSTQSSCREWPGSSYKRNVV